MKRIIANIIMSMSAMFAIGACADEVNVETKTSVNIVHNERGSFAYGADVSWVTQLESENVNFYNSQGVETECMSLLKNECHVNAIRLRVWVNPVDGWNNLADVLVKARRATALGQRIMIDFHLSDTWADPGNQQIPEAWKSYDLPELEKAVANHVTEVLSALKTYNIDPEWVQIGNETRMGMLMPIGEIAKGENFAQLINAGYDAVKKIFPETKVIVHVDQGDNLSLQTYVFDNLTKYQGKYDMIGLSLYPENDTWQTTANACIKNIVTLNKRYGKHIMICEVGMDYTHADACYSLLRKLITEGQSTGALDGIFYWEPEAPAGYNNGYNKGCFDGGKPTKALQAFVEEK